MRETKFRGKRIDDGEWIYGYLADVQEQYGYATINSYFDDEDGRWETCDHVDINTVGQLTGLHDKNGKEIYDDDILLNRHNRRYKVSWSDEEQRRILVNLLNADDYLNMYKNCMDDFEVIGNIHENKLEDIK